MKQQIVRIHWWEVEENYKDYFDYLNKLKYEPFKEKRKKWGMTLEKDLWDDYEIFQPLMPNKQFANYEHWKIMFEKIIPFLRDDFILIWNSLWGTFLLKYLNENDFPLKIKKIILLAPAIKDIPWDLIWSFNFDKKLEHFKKYEKITIIKHSLDDNIVPFSHFEELTKILENSEKITFDWKWHFLNPTFLELIEYIRKIK